MKDKDKSSQKKSIASTGAQSVRRTGSVGGGRTSAPIEARFQAVFESSRDAIGVSKAGVHLFVNPAYLELFGFPRGTDLAGKPVLDLIAPESRDQIRADINRRERGEAALTTYETCGLRTDGSEFDMEVNASSYQENGEDHTLVILRDITGRKRAEEALRESEEKFRALVETSYDWIWAVDENGAYTYASPRVMDILGYSVEEVVGRTPFDFMPQTERKRVARKFGKIVANREPLVALENINRHKDGREVILETSGMPIFDLEGGFKGYRGIDRDITERKHAETALRISEEKFRKVFLTSPDSISINRLEDGMYISINHGFTAITGYSDADVIGRTSLELDIWADPTDRQNLVEGLRKQGQAKNLEARFRTKDGRIIDGLMSASIIDIDHTPHIVSVTRDITLRKQSELALKRSEEKYRRLYNETPILLHSIDRNGIVVDVNDYWLKTMGYARSEVLGRKVTDFYSSASRKYAQDVVHPAFFRDGIAKDISFQFIKKNGDVLDMLLSATAERDAAGNVVRSQAVSEDVTERKRMEEALRRSEERYRDLFENAIDPICIVDDKQNFKDVNKRTTELFGYSRGEFLSMNVRDMIPPEQLPRSDHAFGELARQGAYQQFIGKIRKKDGAFVDVEISSSAIMDNGRIIGSRDFIRDITERKQAEEELRENQARLDLALQSAHMGVWRWEIKENRRYFDDLTCQVLGIEAAAFTGTADEFFRAVHPEDREKIKAAIARTMEQDVLYEPTYRVVWPDGSLHYIAARGRLVRDGRGQPVRINGILWDITDQRLLEQEIIKTQKLESIGTLAGGIAHDFNNLLQGVFGFISMAKLTFDQKEKSLAMLAQAEKALHQSVNLTSQLLTFSKGGKPVKKVLDLRSVIENSAAFALSGSRITYEIVVDKDLRTVEADEGQIGQVIQNIVLNADQAMPLGGMIRVSVRNMPAAAIVPPADLKGDLVEISIRDQGTGIPAEHLASIFDPYFTTKEKGSGLGLATVYSIIKNHGGLIRVQSEVGKGTTFFIYLPSSGAAVKEPKGPIIPAATRKARILVMDDEEMIRAVARELLTAIGHDVACAESGETALEAYQDARDAGTPFDLVILDLTIRGGMGGIATLHKLVELDRDVKAVVSSGYSDDDALSNYRKQGFQAFLKKPYNMEELQNTLNTLLA